MMDCLNLDGYGDVEDPHMEGAKGERQPSGKVDELQSTMDVDLTGITSVEDEGNEKQNAMDVDLKEILPQEDEGKGKVSSDLPSHVPVDFDVASLEKFCKEASRSFFSETGLVSHQINSYNHFVSHGLQELFDSLREITVEPDYDPSKKNGAWKHATIKFGRVELSEPVFMIDNLDLEQQDLKPRHARLQKMTYASWMNVEMTVQVYILDKSDKAKTGKDTHVHRKDMMTETKKVSMGLLPAMVKLNLCWLHKLQESDCQFDFGGYFLIKGTEKVFIAEEQRFLSRIWARDRPSWDASYASQIRREKINIKLVPSKRNEICKVINIYFMGTIMPIWAVFFALGVSSDKEAFDMVGILDCDASIVNIISSTIKESHEQFEGFRTPGRARQYVDELIRKSKFPPKESFDEYVCRYMFPSVSGVRSKALFLGYMVKCLLMAYSGNRKCDNKDDFSNKRLDLACQLLQRELWTHIKRAERRMVKLMHRDLSNYGSLQDLRLYVDASIITNGLNRAFSIGSGQHPFKNERCSGVVATLRRTNPLQMMSDLRKTRQWFAYSGTVGDARYPNPSYWGKLCFLSTTDGEKCGFVKNLAVTAVVSSVVRKPLIDTFVSCGMKKLNDISLQDISGKFRIFLNGDLLGVCADPHELTLRLRSLRHSKLIDPQVEIKMDKHHKEVRVFSDPGRILRPLLVVENLRRITRPKDGLYSFQELMDQNIVELIGVEEEDIRCASGIRHLFAGEKEDGSSGYTHCELDPSFLLGLSCSRIPFANHDNARGVLMEAEKISQQAIGYSPTNSHTRLDTLSHQIFYPQRPLFQTVVSYGLGKAETAYSFGQKDDFSTPEYFNGQNAIVSVNVHQGFNQEDSLVLNRASLERGMFRTLHFKSYKAQVENKEITRRLKHRESINFGKVQSKRWKVDSLECEGLPYVGASLQSGDIVIRKVSESGEDHNAKLMHTEQGMVDKVVLSANDDGVYFATVTLRQSRSPCVGDKFASMHGQKGVVSLLDSLENFPFTSQGIVPDIVINLHGFPTRQTPGQLLEAALGKGIALGGKVRSFTTPTVDVITEQLHKAGFSRWGVESILNGQTGERMKSLVFMGPTFYQRLVHMVEDKVKFRNMGPVHLVTQQPVEDKKRFGGVKFGEMERGCMLAYGAAANLHERLFTLSDFSQMHICQACERVANVIMRPAEGGSKMVHGPYCMFCRSAERIVCVNVPYGSKLLYQELFSMGICLKFDSFAWAATVKFGRVKLGEPVFMVDNSDLEQQDLKFKPRHARLQKMTYASRMNVEMTVQVYILDKSDKAKTGKDTHVHRRDIMTETKQVSMGLLPVMVKSNLCWLLKLQESDCQFDFSGYFLIKGTEKHDRIAWGPMPFVDACWTTLVNKQKFDKDTCCFQHMRRGPSFNLGIRKPIGIRKLKKSFSQNLKSFRNIDHGKFPRYWTYKRLIPANPPLQKDGSCTILSLCIALELRYFIEQKKKQIQDKIEVDMTWVKRICKQAGVYSASEGSHPYGVLDTIMKMGGIITRKCKMQDGEFSRRTIPVRGYTYRQMERMSPSDAIYELYVYGPFVGGLLITEDYESGPEKVYKGCPMPLDGVFHSVICYGYQWIREKLHLEVLDNIDSKAGPYRLVPYEVFDDFVFPYV